MPHLEPQTNTLLVNSKPWEDAIRARGDIADAPAVYAIVTALSFGRLIGTSDILYIGSTRRLGGRSDRARLYAYRYPPTPRERRIKQVCEQLAHSAQQLTLRWLQTPSLIEAQKLEAKLLRQSFEEHHELPPLNHAMPNI